MSAQLHPRCLSVSFMILPLMVLLAAAAEAQDVRAGTKSWPLNSSYLTVTIVPPMSDIKYSVAVTPVDSGGYSPTNSCTYFGVLKKTANSFMVAHRRCSDGAAIAVDAAFLLDWIVARQTQ